MLRKQAEWKGRTTVEAPRRKPRRTGRLEVRTNLWEGESPCKTGLRDDAGFLAWVTGCFLCNESGPKKSEAWWPPNLPTKSVAAASSFVTH